MADDGQNRTDDFCGTVRGPLRSECVGVHVECVPAGAQGGSGPEVLQGVFQQVDVSGLHAADLWSGDVLDLKQFWKTWRPPNERTRSDERGEHTTRGTPDRKSVV